MGRKRLGWTIGIILILALGGVARAGAETLTLDQCVQIALEHDGSSEFGMPSARIGFHQAEQGVWSAWGELLPRIEHSYGYSYRKFGGNIYNPNTGQRISVRSATVSWSTQFGLSHTLFDGGANWYRVAQSYHQRAAQREKLRSAENALILGVKTAYFTLLKSQKLVDVQSAAVRRAEQFHKTIQSKYELGSASLSEVLKAKVEVGSQQYQLLSRQNDAQTGRARLNTILNRAVDEPLEIAEVGASEPAVPSYEEATAAALRESPNVLVAQASLRAAKDDIGIARATLFPSVSWSLTRYYNPFRRNDLLSFPDTVGSWFAGATLSIPIFEGFQRKTAISNARVNLKYTRETLDQAERAAALAVKEQYLGVQLAQEAYKLAAQTDSSAQEDFNLAQEKYNLGAATILDLLGAQASLTTAQTDRVNSLFDYFVAIARLENATGKGR
ncbi:MAG: TolC family protein [candidate division Zixibacteria bacterium]|nr:TolC family protein [candidate division Zixibacteria bacterium]